jgi:hypothetical protein
MIGSLVHKLEQEFFQYLTLLCDAVGKENIYFDRELSVVETH